MEILLKCSYLLIIISNLCNKVLLEFPSENYCSAEDSKDDEAWTHWYSQVYSFVHTNQNITQHMTKLNEQFLKMKTTQQELRQELKQQQDSLKIQLEKMDVQITELKEQYSKCTSSINDEIVIQRRQDGSENFYRSWEEYKEGFGNTTGEFFMGLEKLHKLTYSRPYSLLIVMEDWKNRRRYAKYDHFVIGSELEKYTLKELGAYTGTAGDSLSYHKGQKFSTKDQENDSNPKKHCAQSFMGAWWYNSCHDSNLNGLYIKNHVGSGQWAQGIHWQEWTGHDKTLKFVEMILRRL